MPAYCSGKGGGKAHIILRAAQHLGKMRQPKPPCPGSCRQLRRLTEGAVSVGDGLIHVGIIADVLGKY